MSHELPERKTPDAIGLLYVRVLEAVIGNLLASGYTDWKRIRDSVGMGDAVNAVIGDLTDAGIITQHSGGRRIWYTPTVDKDDLITALYSLTAKAKQSAAKVGG